MPRPTLFLTIGLPGTGKTTAARQIEAEHNALRPGESTRGVRRDRRRLIRLGLHALELGTNVVLDFGLWSRDERSALRQAAVDVGASVELRYYELAPDEQRKRLDRRRAEAPHATWPISDEELAGWAAKLDIPTAAELDGSEPVGPPPDGLASWDEWRRHRWPPSVQSA